MCFGGLTHFTLTVLTECSQLNRVCDSAISTLAEKLWGGYHGTTPRKDE